MDTEHRHELKQNDFVVYAKQAPQYLKTHWWEVICVIVIVAAVVMIFSDKKEELPNMDKQAKVTAIYQDIAAAKSDAISGQGTVDKIDELVRDLLDKSSKLSGQQKAVALIEAADALRSKLHYSDGMPAKDIVDATTSEAVSLYEQAVKEAKGYAEVEAMATYSMALAKHDAGNFDEAANIYGQIIANTAFDKTAFVALSKDKLATIAMSKQQFNFVQVAAPAAVEPAAEPTAAPAVAPEKK